MKKLVLMVLLSSVMVQGLEGAGAGASAGGGAGGAWVCGYGPDAEFQRCGSCEKELLADDGAVVQPCEHSLCQMCAAAGKECQQPVAKKHLLESGVDGEEDGEEMMPPVAKQQRVGASAAGAPAGGSSGRRTATFSQAPDGIVLELLKFLSVSDQVNLGKALGTQGAELHPVVMQYVNKMCASLITTYGVNSVLFCPDDSDNSPNAVKHREILRDPLYVRELIRQGANYLFQDHRGINALLWAVLLDEVDIVKALLNAIPDAMQRAELVKAPDVDGQTALHLAAIDENMDIVNALLDAVIGAQRVNLVQARDLDEQTALHLASAGGNVNLVSTLLAAMPNDTQRAALVRARDDEGQTALHLASHVGSEEIAVALLQSVPEEQLVAFIQAVDNNGMTALDFCIENGFAQAILGGVNTIQTMENRQELLRRMPEIKQLRLFALVGDVDQARSLLAGVLQRARFVQSRDPVSGKTVLHSAVAGGHVDSVQFVLAEVPLGLRAAFVAMRGVDGNSALDLAVEKGYQDIVDILTPYVGDAASEVAE